jgi:hypothetical protein
MARIRLSREKKFGLTNWNKSRAREKNLECGYQMTHWWAQRKRNGNATSNTTIFSASRTFLRWQKSSSHRTNSQTRSASKKKLIREKWQLHLLKCWSWSDRFLSVSLARYLPGLLTQMNTPSEHMHVVFLMHATYCSLFVFNFQSLLFDSRLAKNRFYVQI